MTLLSWIFGNGAMASLFLMNQQKNRERMLWCKLCADVFWGAHYFCLGAVGGMIPNVVGIVREGIYLNRRKHKWASSVVWPIIFVIIIFTVGLFSFKSLINILPITASCCATAVLWLQRPRLTKFVLIFVSSAFLIYDIFVGSYIGIINEMLSISSAIIYFTREAIEKRRDKNEKGIQ
jgi:hypothetical protein